MPDVDAIVVGSGPGGLAAALTLAREGLLVLVLEQHYLPGGFCHSFPLGGHLWSPGVHYIGQLGPGEPARRFYEAMGVSDELVFCALDPDGYDQVVLPGRRVAHVAGWPRNRAHMAETFPADAEGIGAWFDELEALAEGAASLGTVGARANGALSRWGHRSLEGMLHHHVTDPVARAVLAVQGVNYGLPPSRTPAVVHAEMAAHYAGGGAFPLSGGRAIPRAFIHALHREGGEIQVKARVTEILTEAAGGGRRAVGVRLANGETVSAGVVVSNADPAVTFRRLVGADNLSEPLRRRLDQTPWSTSCLSLFLTADLGPDAGGLRSSNYWLLADPDLERAYALPELSSLDALPCVFATVTTLKDPSSRRGGLHAIEAFAPVSYAPFASWAGTGHGARPAEYQALKAHLTERMLDALRPILPEIRDQVRFCSLGTPLTNSHFCEATRGAIYGVEKTLDRASARGFAQRTEVDQLYLCGASTRSHGVYGAGMTGLHAACQILGLSADEVLARPGPSLRVVPADSPEDWPEDLRRKVPA